MRTSAEGLELPPIWRSKLTGPSDVLDQTEGGRTKAAAVEATTRCWQAPAAPGHNKSLPQRPVGEHRAKAVDRAPSFDQQGTQLSHSLHAAHLALEVEQR